MLVFCLCAGPYIYTYIYSIYVQKYTDRHRERERDMPIWVFKTPHPNAAAVSRLIRHKIHHPVVRVICLSNTEQHANLFYQ